MYETYSKTLLHLIDLLYTCRKEEHVTQLTSLCRLTLVLITEMYCSSEELPYFELCTLLLFVILNYTYLTDSCTVAHFDHDCYGLTTTYCDLQKLNVKYM